MKKTLLIVFYLFFCSSVFSQITVNTDSPNNDINHLVNNVLLSSGVQASFNRWGELMFQTNNLSEFWDGKYKNRVVPPGTYSYDAKIYGKDAKYKFQNRTVNVLK